MTEQETAEAVARRLEGKVQVTYYAKATVYYETTIEAESRERADNMYYGGEVELEIVDESDFETYDVVEE